MHANTSLFSELKNQLARLQQADGQLLNLEHYLGIDVGPIQFATTVPKSLNEINYLLDLATDRIERRVSNLMRVLMPAPSPVQNQCSMGQTPVSNLNISDLIARTAEAVGNVILNRLNPEQQAAGCPGNPEKPQRRSRAKK